MHAASLAWSGVLTLVLLAGPAYAQVAGPFATPEPRTARADAGQSLAATAGSDAVALVQAYLRDAGHSDATVASLVLASRSTVARTGVTHLRFVQRLGDLEVYGTYVKASVNAQGALTSVIENVVAARGVASAALDGGEGRALAIGLQHVHGGAPVPPGLVRRQGNTSVFARTPFFHREPTVTRVAIPVGNALHAGYLVETWTERGNQLHHTIVGGDGAVLGVESRTANDSYHVFTNSPEKGGQTTTLGPGAGTADSQAGWLFSGPQKTTSIAGNNVHAYLDANADNLVDAGGTVVEGRDFLAVWDGAAQPGTTANKAVATQNLFYLNNLTHDVLYRHGFDEAALNFQESNFGNGGLGSDSVLAEVQDGSGTDNANFATPSDGSNPRMQMFIWNAIGDSEVVPPAAVGSTPYTAQAASFAPKPSATGVTGALTLVGEACDRFARGALKGVVAVIDRGTCNFDAKVSNVQRAGATAAVIVNNVAGAIFTMSGSNTSAIPAVMISLADGTALKTGRGQNGSVRASASAPVNRDSSLDADIVYHEYGHGLTWRMIGSMSGAMSGAIGEGMSDVLALLLNNDESTNDDVVGEFAAFDPRGIRSEPYDTYSRSYGDFSGAGVHFDGEIYGAIGYRLRRNFLRAGLAIRDTHTADATPTLLDHLVDGMNYTQASPAFEHMRDGILQSLQNDTDLGAGDRTSRACLVWDAFADFGVGVGAKATVKRSGSIAVIESTTLPAGCTAVN